MRSNAKKRLIVALLLPVLSVASFAAIAADIDRQVFFEPSAMVLARLKPGPDGKISTWILRGKEAQFAVNTKHPNPAGTESSAEMHSAIDVFYYVLDGKANIDVGNKLEGATESPKNEWNGGKIVDKKVYTLSKGDIFWLPAGTAKIMTVPPGESFTYLAVRHASSAPAENLPASTLK